MVDGIAFNDSSTEGRPDYSNALIHRVGLFDWVKGFNLLTYSESSADRAVDDAVKNASQAFDHDMETMTPDSMQAAIDAYGQIPVDTAHGGAYWKHLIEGWKQEVDRDHRNYTQNLTLRGYTVLYTAEGENQLRAGSQIPSSMWGGKEPRFILKDKKNADGSYEPLGYDMFNSALYSLYKAKEYLELEKHDKGASESEKASLAPVDHMIVGDIIDIFTSDHHVDAMVTELADKVLPQYDLGGLKDYLVHTVLPQAQTFNLHVKSGNTPDFYPINSAMKGAFERKAWLGLTMLDLADVQRTLAGEVVKGSRLSTARSIFLGTEEDQRVYGYQGIWQALGNSRENNNIDWEKAREKAVCQAKQLKIQVPSEFDLPTKCE
jgi:hypothetical protein